MIKVDVFIAYITLPYCTQFYPAVAVTSGFTCPEGWIIREDFCYSFNTEPGWSRDDANRHCASLSTGATLAILDTKAKVDFAAGHIRNMAPATDIFWLLGHYDRSNETWYWTDHNGNIYC